MGGVFSVSGETVDFQLHSNNFKVNFHVAPQTQEPGKVFQTPGHYCFHGY